MQTCFLLGSGISLPAKLPSVDEITEQVLSTKDFFPDSDGFYRRIKAGHRCSTLVKTTGPEMERIRHFLLWLKGLAELRFAGETGWLVTYEELAYLAAQISDDASGNQENPALGPLIEGALKTLPSFSTAGSEGPSQLGQLAGKTVDYIADVVAEMLAKNPESSNHLRLFRDAVMAQRLGLGTVSLFTLNHDCLLEKFLRSEQIDVIDGFDKEDDLGIRIWNPHLLEIRPADLTKAAVQLFKLHGSIDWQRFRPRATNGKNPWSKEYVGIQSISSLAQVNRREIESLGRAQFLAGKFNKMTGYLNHVFLELHYRFHLAMADASRLVVCGYGFGDKGINNRITDWMCLSEDSVHRKMILIDPKSLEQVRATSRGAIAAKLPSWTEEGRFIHLEFPIGHKSLTWERVSAELLVK